MKSLLLLLLLSTAASASPDQIAASYEASILPANNTYGSPSTITTVGGVLIANTTCSGYAALVEEATFSTVTNAVIHGLTGNGLPTSVQWKDAMDSGATYTNDAGTFGFVVRDAIWDMIHGDLFTSTYTDAGTTGHTLIIGTTTQAGYNIAVSSIPGYTVADRWKVLAHDSSTVPHGTGDSRYHADAGSVDDEGIGHGYFYLYSDHDTGAIVGWTWNTYSTTVYQAVDSNSSNYRPVTIGALTGPGI